MLFLSSLLCHWFCVYESRSKLVTAHTLIYSNYIHKCASSLVAVAQCECARPCTRSHMYAHLKRTNHPSMQYSAGLSELGVPGVPCPPPSPDFDRSVNPIQTGGSRLCPQHYYLPQQIFIPSCGPVVCLLRSDVWTAAVKTNQPITVGFFFLIVQYYCRLLKS